MIHAVSEPSDFLLRESGAFINPAGSRHTGAVSALDPSKLRQGGWIGNSDPRGFFELGIVDCPHFFAFLFFTDGREE